jgi:hypothetical protein
MDKDLHWKEMCGKSFLSADDIPEGKEITLTITYAGMDEVYDPGTRKTLQKGIVGFKETEFRLVLNVTNSRAIASHHGNKTGGWLNKTVTLTRQTCKVAGKVVPCVRIKPFSN